MAMGEQMEELKQIREALVLAGVNLMYVPDPLGRDEEVIKAGKVSFETLMTTYTRILQNMIEEAEENLADLAEKMHGYESLKRLDERRVQLREAMALVATLDPEHYKAPEEGKNER
jgi:hypothetical protein